MIEDPILLLKDQTSFDSLYDINSCSVAVVYAVYDPKKKRIVNKGTSRACGENHNQISIHAERKGINYCRTYDKKSKYEIYIWRYSKEGKVKPVFCCGACTKLLSKFNYENVSWFSARSVTAFQISWGSPRCGPCPSGPGPIR